MKVERSIAEGPRRAPSPAPRARGPMTAVVGLLLALVAFGAYWASNPERWNTYNHFVWQADAFLDGRAWIPYPVPPGGELPPNDHLQDVFPLRDEAGEPDGRALLPFPPLPALVLLPFVALFGLETDQEAIAVGLGALGVAAAWWMLGGLRLRTEVRALATVVFAGGTTWWWASAVGSTWYLAHIVAVLFALLAVGVALRADARSAEEDPWDEDEREWERMAAAGRAGSLLDRLRASAWPLDRSQVIVGFLLGLAVTARLPLIFAAPFFMLVGGGGSRLRRTLSAAVGGVLPVAALLAYTVLTTGSVLHPGYDYQYRLEAYGYPMLGYNPEWAVEDVRYIPQNAGIMFGSLPAILPETRPDTLGFSEPVPLCTDPGARRSLFDPRCPWAMPVDTGTSILLSAPGLLLALFAFRRRPLARLALGTAAAVVIVALFNLAHFSQGWVQWGYRFSLDFLPFLLPMVALGAARADGRPREAAVVLLVAGGAVNLWGVAWGQILGW